MAQEQAYLFLVFSLTGVAIGCLFDFFRVLRKTFKTADIITYIEDILFWILAGILILYNIWYFNNGEIRLFMIIGIIMGALIYTLTLSNLFVSIDSFLMLLIKKALTFLYNFFNIPIKLVKNILRKIFNSISQIIENFTKFVKKPRKKIMTKVKN